MLAFFMADMCSWCWSGSAHPCSFLLVADMYSWCRLSRGASSSLGAEAAGAVLAEQKAQGMDLAAKMMEKMGWKTGLGLGRNKQVWPVTVPFVA